MKQYGKLLYSIRPTHTTDWSHDNYLCQVCWVFICNNVNMPIKAFHVQFCCFSNQLTTSQNWGSLTVSAMFFMWRSKWRMTSWEIRWSPDSCEMALRCLSGINQVGQRNFDLERFMSTNISPSGYIKPKFVVLSSFNISCCQERSVGQNFRPLTILSRL